MKSTTRWTSPSETKAPCRRCTRAVPGGRKSMSPSPSRRSAPIASRMVRESVREVTRKEMRAGKLALMRPVMTSTEGRWVARIRWMPAARAFCARRVIDSSISRPTIIISSASSSMMMMMRGTWWCRRPSAAAGARDQEMRHARQVGHHRVPGRVLAEREGELRLGVLVFDALEELADEDLLATRVGDLDADHGLAGDGGQHAHRERAQRHREV